MFGYTRAMRSKAVIMLFNSVEFDLRNLRLAGTLKNRFSTRKLLPAGQEHGSCDRILLPAIESDVPSWSASRRVRSSTCATAAIEASASPRNPMVWSVNKSAASRIFEVACRSNAIRASVAVIPEPLSSTCTEVRPASTTAMFMVVARASMAFSTSSFMMDAGR